MTKAAGEAVTHFYLVAVDGTWQRHGFSSKNGVVTVLTYLGKHQANKVIDTDISNMYCNTCAQKNRNNVKLSTIAKDRRCTVNHQGSDGKMEADGAVACFKRSKAYYGVQ